MNIEVAERIQMLRKRCGLSIRQLAGQSGVTASMISCIERGKNSPSIVTLQKILSALGTNLATFFSTTREQQEGPVFLREHMKAISDGDRTYTLVFSEHPGVAVGFFDETIRPSKQRPKYEILKCDVAGYILSGSLVLEIKNEPKQILRPGDAFYIHKEQEHRGFTAEDEIVRVITVCCPARY